MSENTALDPVAVLPAELVIGVFACLPKRDVASCRAVSRAWREAASDPMLPAYAALHIKIRAKDQDWMGLLAPAAGHLLAGLNVLSFEGLRTRVESVLLNIGWMRDRMPRLEWLSLPESTHELQASELRCLPTGLLGLDVATVVPSALPELARLTRLEALRLRSKFDDFPTDAFPNLRRLLLTSAGSGWDFHSFYESLAGSRCAPRLEALGIQAMFWPESDVIWQWLSSFPNLSEIDISVCDAAADTAKMAEQVARCPRLVCAVIHAQTTELWPMWDAMPNLVVLKTSGSRQTRMPRSDRLRIFSSLETIDGDRLAALLGACPSLNAFTANVTEDSAMEVLIHEVAGKRDLLYGSLRPMSSEPEYAAFHDALATANGIDLCPLIEVNVGMRDTVVQRLVSRLTYQELARVERGIVTLTT